MDKSDVTQKRTPRIFGVREIHGQRTIDSWFQLNPETPKKKIINIKHT